MPAFSSWHVVVAAHVTVLAHLVVPLSAAYFLAASFTSVCACRMFVTYGCYLPLLFGHPYWVPFIWWWCACVLCSGSPLHKNVRRRQIWRKLFLTQIIQRAISTGCHLAKVWCSQPLMSTCLSEALESVWRSLCVSEDVFFLRYIIFHRGSHFSSLWHCV